MAANSIHPMESNNMSPLINGNGVPPSPSQQSTATDDESLYHLPAIPSMSRLWGCMGTGCRSFNNLSVLACVVLDRRPITPPLIARLLIFDPLSKEEIDYERNAEWSKLILGVDLWNAHGTREDNCVRHNAAAPSISSTTTTVYPAISQPLRTSQTLTPYDLMNLPSYRRERDFLSASNPASLPTSPYEQRNPSRTINHDQRHNGHYQNGYETSFHHQGSTQEPVLSPAPSHHSRISQDMGSPNPNRSEPSKNLIGQCHTSVQKLVGQDGKVGLFFIFQDLSVRTEGWFRLKCSLFALGRLGFEEEATAEARNGLLFEAPCLASVFSSPFKVFSAKKFPGVVETTELSQLFAEQGIKIPIRKSDGKSKKRGKEGENDDDDAADDDDE